MKKLEDYDWMCPEPFTNILYSVSGNIKPCCAFHADAATLRKHNWNMHFHSSKDSFETYYHSDQMKRLRAAMRDGGDDEFLNDICAVCKIQEKSGNRSHRQFYISRFYNEKEFAHRRSELENIIATDSDPTFLHSAEINGTRGNVCNLQCNFCSSGSSSSYNKEAVDLGEQTIRIKSKPDITEEFQEDLIKIVNLADELKFTGGEPLIGNDLIRLLESVENPQDKLVRTITNGTQPVDKFIEATKPFKNTIVNVSIEAFGKFNDYIRYPSDWNTIDSNVKKLVSAGHISVYVSSTVNAINVGKIYELSEYFGDSFVAGSYIVNNFYRINSIPPDIKDQYLNTLYRYGRHKEVQKVIKYVENVEWNEEGMYGMLSHIKRRDKHRGTNLLEFAPEWKKYYDKIL